MKITRFSDWGYEVDRLGGVALKQDEELIVTWPDGVEELVEVELDVRSVTIGDMGHDHTTTATNAYVTTSHHGAPARVSLVGVEARRP